MNVRSRPFVGIAASHMETATGRFMTHGTSSVLVDSTARFSHCTPFLIPGVPSQLDLDNLVERMDGLLLPGGRANVEPHHFDGAPFPDDEPIDPGRDGTVIPLIRTCIEREVPIFGICRGIQEMNVAMGGSLHYRIHLLDGKDDHRMPRHDDVTREEIFRLRHAVALTGSLAKIAGSAEVLVNSLHGQGIDRLADAFTVEAVSPDGVIEGIRLKNDRTFTAGVQWHAEWEPENHELSRRLFEHFGEAAYERMCARRPAPRRVAVHAVP
ncbi:MAG: gamma-glutamyl-gamma-aminobutyrate hydrolase family protein [Pseudomonadota bacterium]